jgi:hypothetical protein
VGFFLSGPGKFSYPTPTAAYFVQSTFSAYEKHVEFSPQDQDEPGKEASNLIVLVSELYNFQVISCILIYDVVRDLRNQPRLSEYTVELLLKIVKGKRPHFVVHTSAEFSKVPGCSSDKMTRPR